MGYWVSLDSPSSKSARGKGENLISEESWTYTAAGLVATHTDGEGNLTTYTHDARGNVTHITIEDAAENLVYEESWQYNAENQLTSHTDAAGNVRTLTYEDGFLIHEETRDSEQNLISEVDYDWDEDGNLVGWTDGEGNVTTLEVDGAGRVTSQETRQHSPRKCDQSGVKDTERHRYNELGKLEHVDAPDGKGNSIGIDYHYDEGGQLKERVITLPDGTVTRQLPLFDASGKEIGQWSVTVNDKGGMMYQLTLPTSAAAYEAKVLDALKTWSAAHGVPVVYDTGHGKLLITPAEAAMDTDPLPALAQRYGIELTGIRGNDEAAVMNAFAHDKIYVSNLGDGLHQVLVRDAANNPDAPMPINLTGNDIAAFNNIRATGDPNLMFIPPAPDPSAGGTLPVIDPNAAPEPGKFFDQLTTWAAGVEKAALDVFGKVGQAILNFNNTLGYGFAFAVDLTRSINPFATPDQRFAAYQDAKNDLRQGPQQALDVVDHALAATDSTVVNTMTEIAKVGASLISSDYFYLKAQLDPALSQVDRDAYMNYSQELLDHGGYQAMAEVQQAVQNPGKLALDFVKSGADMAGQALEAAARGDGATLGDIGGTLLGMDLMMRFALNLDGLPQTLNVLHGELPETFAVRPATVVEPSGSLMDTLGDKIVDPQVAEAAGRDWLSRTPAVDSGLHEVFSTGSTPHAGIDAIPESPTVGLIEGLLPAGQSGPLTGVALRQFLSDLAEKSPVTARQAGMADEQFRLMDELVKRGVDAQGQPVADIVAVRITKEAAIQWTEQNFPAKDVNIKIKASEQTALATATNDIEAATARREGYFVIEAIADNTVAARGPDGALIELENPKWPVEPGQVIDPILACRYAATSTWVARSESTTRGRMPL